MPEYMVSARFFDCKILTARDEESAVLKFKRRLPKGLRSKVSITAEQKRRCAGTWHKGCTNLLNFNSTDDECDKCSYAREQDRINSPG